MKKAIITSLSVLILSGCAPPTDVSPQKTPLEIQAIQKRVFETSKKIAFGSVVSVLQDLGYIIGNADFETGIITGNSPTINTTSGAEVFLGALAGTGWNTSNTTTKVSAFIEELKDGVVSVRFNFVVNSSSSSSYGQDSTTDVPIYAPDVYINAFNKVEEGIFIRS